MRDGALKVHTYDSSIPASAPFRSSALPVAQTRAWAIASRSIPAILSVSLLLLAAAAPPPALVHVSEITTRLEKLMQARELAARDAGAPPEVLAMIRWHRWNNTYILSSSSYIHVGWRRKNATEFHGIRHGTLASAPGARLGSSPAFRGRWDDRRACSVIWQSTMCYRYARSPFPDCPRYTQCDGQPTSVMPRNPRSAKRRITACINTVYDHNGAALNRSWLEQWLLWHQRLGVEHFFIYVAMQPYVHVPGVSYDWIDVSWMTEFYDQAFGRLWVANDCTYMNRELENEWGLFLDLDEAVFLPGIPKGLPAVVEAIEADGYNHADIATVSYTPFICAPPHADPNATAGAGATAGELIERINHRNRFAANCNDVWGATCPEEPVHRKLLTRFTAVEIMGVHRVWTVSRGENNVNTVALNASRLWLKHVRGAHFMRDGDVCGGASPSCAPIGNGENGYNCAHSQLHPGRHNIDDTFVNDEESITRAISMGSIRAGANYGYWPGGGPEFFSPGFRGTPAGIRRKQRWPFIVIPAEDTSGTAGIDNS